jgi:hypothetical protein
MNQSMAENFMRSASAGNQRRGNDGERHLEADVHASGMVAASGLGLPIPPLPMSLRCPSGTCDPGSDKGVLGAKRHAVGDEREENRRGR